MYVQCMYFTCTVKYISIAVHRCKCTSLYMYYTYTQYTSAYTVMSIILLLWYFTLAAVCHPWVSPLIDPCSSVAQKVRSLQTHKVTLEGECYITVEAHPIQLMVPTSVQVTNRHMQPDVSLCIPSACGSYRLCGVHGGFTSPCKYVVARESGNIDGTDWLYIQFIVFKVLKRQEFIGNRQDHSALEMAKIVNPKTGKFSQNQQVFFC